MKLLTPEIEKALKLFPLHSTEDIYLSNKIFICKFFNPVGAGTWYVCDGEVVTSHRCCDSDDWEFFGLVDLGMGQEWGYFRLSELEELTLPMGLGIERDIHFRNEPAIKHLKDFEFGDQA